MADSFEFAKIKPDGYATRETDSGKTVKIPLYSRRTQYREHGQSLMKDLLQIHELDLLEGPRLNLDPKVSDAD